MGNPFNQGDDFDRSYIVFQTIRHYVRSSDHAYSFISIMTGRLCQGGGLQREVTMGGHSRSVQQHPMPFPPRGLSIAVCL
jgi:hypothetical protein